MRTCVPGCNGGLAPSQWCLCARLLSTHLVVAKLLEEMPRVAAGCRCTYMLLYLFYRPNLQLRTMMLKTATIDALEPFRLRVDYGRLGHELSPRIFDSIDLPGKYHDDRTRFQTTTLRFTYHS